MNESLNIRANRWFTIFSSPCQHPPTDFQDRQAFPALQSSSMSPTSQAVTRTPAEVVRLAPVSQALNGICYSVMGEVTAAVADLERMVTAVPRTIAAALNRKAY